MSQHERRHTPYPWTWEPAAGVLTALSMVGLVGLQLGRTVANGLAAGAWRVAPTDEWVASVPGLLRGDAAAGLHPSPTTIATRGLLTGCLIATDAALVGLAVVAVVVGWRRWGPHRPRGYATPAEVDRVLGLSRLRRSASLVRPDLPDPRRHLFNLVAEHLGRPSRIVARVLRCGNRKLREAVWSGDAPSDGEGPADDWE